MRQQRNHEEDCFLQVFGYLTAQAREQIAASAAIADPSLPAATDHVLPPGIASAVAAEGLGELA
jgi:hypothetical protein